jgi:hypothetical protein
MNNLASRNQLYEWSHFEDSTELEKINDYYECLIECTDTHQASCKRICKEVLMWIAYIVYRVKEVKEVSIGTSFFVPKYL